MEKKFLCYEQFGAVGDGKTDDLGAIVACHAEANRLGLPVRATDGAVYYIGGKSITAVIKTDVDFGKAKFIIDDRSREDIRSYVFSVESDHKFESVDIPTLAVGQKRLSLGKEGSYLVRVYDESHPVFIRKGLNMNSGTPTQEVFTVDGEGNIGQSVNFDYPTVTRAEARCTDDTPITVRGGVFVTVANQQESYYRYHQRGFQVTRSHVTLCGFEHYVEGELDHGAPYHGFVRADHAVDLTVRDATVTPRFVYYTESKIPGKPVPMGSYDLSFWSSIGVRCINVKQTVDITDSRYWGVYTSNFCKDLTVDNCVFSRFDAHQGVTGFVIRNSKLGHQGIQLIGFGHGVIENTEVFSGALFSLRPDYGATWTGDVTVKDCVWHPRHGSASLFSSWNSEDHDFGYPCSEPSSITVDGLRICDNAVAHEPVYLLPKFTNEPVEGQKLAPYGRVRTLKVKGLSTETGREVGLCVRPELYADTETVFEDQNI